MKNDLQRLKEQLDTILSYTGTDSQEALLLSRKIDLLINEHYMRKYLNILSCAMK
jgi:hypothetical protein